jgi:hypothetical protein
MEATGLEAKRLRPEIIQRVEAMDEESLLLLHRLLLRMEKERLWRELSAEAEVDRRSGKFDRLSDIIREARAELRGSIELIVMLALANQLANRVVSGL